VTRDLFSVLRICGQAFPASDELVDVLTAADRPIPEDDGPERDAALLLVGTSIAWALLTRLVERAEGPTVAWLADLAGMTSDELLNSDLDTMPELIGAIARADGAADFFVKCRDMLASQRP